MESSPLDRPFALSLSANPARPSVPLAVMVQAMVIVLVTANLGRIPLVSTGDREAPLLVNDLAVIAMVMMGATACLTARLLRVDRIILAAGAFVMLGAGSAFYHARSLGLSSFELAISLAYLARWALYFSVYIVVVNVVRVIDVKAVWKATETTLLVIASFGIVQAAVLPGFAQMVYPDSRAYIDWDIQGHRLVSTVLEPNIAGAMILIGLLIELAQLSSGARVQHWKPLVLFAALVLTLSRSAALGLVAGVCVILVARGLSKRLLRWLGAITVLGLALLPKIIAFGMAYGKFSTGGSAAARLVVWARAWRIFTDHVWFGVGFNTYGYVQEHYGYERLGSGTYSADGGLLFVAVLTGIAGLAAFVWLYGLVIAQCRRTWRDRGRSADERGLAIGVAAALVALSVDSLFVNSLLTTFVMELVWIVCGLSTVIAAPRPLARPYGVPRLVGAAHL